MTIRVTDPAGTAQTLEVEGATRFVVFSRDVRFPSRPWRHAGSHRTEKSALIKQRDLRAVGYAARIVAVNP